MSDFQLPPPRENLIWASIDLDGTLAEGVWTPDSDGRHIGEPIWRNVRKADRLVEAGYKIVIHTARGYEHYEAIESWLLHYGIAYSRIVCGKLLAKVYVDDRAVWSEEESWLDEDVAPDYYGKHREPGKYDVVLALAYEKQIELLLNDQPQYRFPVEGWLCR